MRAHQAAGVYTQLVLARGFVEDLHERPTIVVIFDDSHFAIAARHHVVHGAGKLNTIRP